MTKQEFLEMMRLALNGKVSSSLVMENLRYYEDYINMEVRKGEKEEDVLAKLGDPRLLARTIAETSGAGNGQSAEYAGEGMRYERSEEYRPDSRGRQFWLKVLSKVPLWGVADSGAVDCHGGFKRGVFDYRRNSASTSADSFGAFSCEGIS